MSKHFYNCYMDTAKIVKGGVLTLESTELVPTPLSGWVVNKENK